MKVLVISACRMAIESRSACALLASSDEDAYVTLTLGNMREPSTCSPQQRDVLCSGTTMFFFWCLPTFAFAIGFFVSPGLRMVLWTLSLGFMGTICLLNASRCGRIHCYFTGPFFILGAIASLGYGIGLLPFGPSGWKWIGNITIIGAIMLAAIPESILGRYRRNRSG